MGDSPVFGRCDFCNRTFERRGGPGRPRDYCGETCQRKAQRQRDRERARTRSCAPPAVLRSVADIADDLRLSAGQLPYHGADKEPLAVGLARAEQITRAAVSYRAAVVRQALRDGETWESVAASADVSVRTAHARWSEPRIRRLLTVPLPPLPAPRGSGMSAEPSGAPQPGEVIARPPRERLRAALSALRRTSCLTVVAAARQALLPADQVQRVLTGEAGCTWPVLHMLVTVLGGDATEFRWAWERAYRALPDARPSGGHAVGELAAALRGLYLAAGRPDLSQLCAGTPLPPEQAAAVLRGTHAPDWATTVSLATRLAAAPLELRPLWEDVHYSVLAARHAFPAGGLPRTPADT